MTNDSAPLRFIDVITSSLHKFNDNDNLLSVIENDFDLVLSE
jgi:hypothetical protein